MTRQELIIKRRRKDKLIKAAISLVSSLALVVLAAIVIYIVVTGIHLVKWETITGDSASINSDVYLEEGPANFTNEYDGDEDIYFSKQWGIAFYDTFNKEGHPIVEVAYVTKDSPFNNAIDKNNLNESGENNIINVTKGFTFSGAFLRNESNTLEIVLATRSAEEVATALDSNVEVSSFTIQKTGGGIRGSIITTLYLIVLTMCLAVPIGISTAIYFNEYSKNTQFSSVIKYLVDLLTGVPSIIYGLLGAAVFIPLSNTIFNTQGGSIISGSLTLAVIILPVIIKSTEEALKVIPNDLRNASLALGASKTQTTFRVVLPSAIPGILTGVMLSIGRVIGESAALIFAVGVAIKDVVELDQKSTSLAVHIWTAMGGEAPNFELASAIAIIILLIVFVLNILVKIIGNKMNKAWY